MRSWVWKKSRITQQGAISGDGNTERGTEKGIGWMVWFGPVNFKNLIKSSNEDYQQGNWTY